MSWATTAASGAGTADVVDDVMAKMHGIIFSSRLQDRIELDG